MLILISSEKDLKLAGQLLKNGEFVAFPIETAFGVGCIFDNETEFKTLNNLKTKKLKKVLLNFIPLCLIVLKILKNMLF